MLHFVHVIRNFKNFEYLVNAENNLHFRYMFTNFQRLGYRFIGLTTSEERKNQIHDKRTIKKEKYDTQ